MKEIKYKIKLFSYWHTGSGLIGGSDSNASVIRDADLLPYIPGKTLKGLLRDAAESIKELNPELLPTNFIPKIFGEAVDKTGNKDIYGKESAFFANAILSPSIKSNLSKEDKENFYDLISSTSIDNEGQAKDGSLRTMEACIPVVLNASIHDFPDSQEYTNAMETCFQWVKFLGTNRNRGLGRCHFIISKNN